MSDWIVIQPSLNKITDQLQPIVDGVSGLLEILIQTLNLAETTLNIIKAFTTGILDPLIPLLKAVIKQIQNILSDLRQLGFYFHGDWNLLDSKNNYADVVGGYEGYENRMVTRLLDPSDSNRPDFSSSSGVLGVFLYVSEGDTGIGRIVDLIQQIIEFFGLRNVMGDSDPYSIPIPTEIKYMEYESKLLKAYKDLQSVPEKLSLSWTFPNTGGIPFLDTPAPQGYLIHISTIPEPLQLMGLRVYNTITLGNVVIDPITNNALEWYGDLADLQIEPVTGKFSQRLKIGLKNSSTPFILLEDWIDNVIGKTFVVNTDFMTKLAGGESLTSLIDVEDLPLHADIQVQGATGKLVNIRRAENLYIRIRGVVNPVGQGTLKQPQRIQQPIYNIPSKDLFLGTGVYTAQVNSKNYTKVSQPIQAKIPQPLKLDYKNALIDAICFLLLCRPDFNEAPKFTSGVEKGDYYFTDNTYIQETGLEYLGRMLMLKYNITDSVYKTGNPRTFCSKILLLSRTIAEDMLSKFVPPQEVLDTLQFQIKQIQTTVLYEGKTISELLQIPEKGFGIAGNPLGIGIHKRTLKSLYETGKLKGASRYPAFKSKYTVEINTWSMGMGSGDNSPVVYTTTEEFNEVVFFRNYVLKEDNGFLPLIDYIKSLLMVGINQPQIKDKGWTKINVLNTMVPEAEQFFTIVEDKALSLLEAVESQAEKIDKAIENVQARIESLETLLQELQTLIDSLLSMSLPQVSALVVTANGTGGLVNELVSSTNKPVSATSERAAGAVLVAGGVPSFVIEFLLDLLVSE